MSRQPQWAEIRVKLPKSLVREAEASGLLRPETMELLLRWELRRRRVDELFAAADRLADLPEPPLTPEEIQAEIDQVRRRGTAADAGGG
jgi:hypothetical protein